MNETKKNLRGMHAELSHVETPLLRSNSFPQISTLSSCNKSDLPNYVNNPKYGKVVVGLANNYFTNLSADIMKLQGGGSVNYYDDNVQPDIKAMSILSVYEKENNLEEMDTDIDFQKPTPKIFIKKPSTRMNEETANALPLTAQSNSSHITQGNNYKCPKPTIYFNDGIRSVDFVIVWDSFDEQSLSKEADKKRKTFEANLVREGLELEYELPESNGLCFVKIHAPKEVLRRYSEILKLRMPMRSIPALKQMETKTNFILEGIKSKWNLVKNLVHIDKSKFPEKRQRFTAIYSRDREYLFDVDSPCFFTPAIHSRIVQFILDRKKFTQDSGDYFAFGIERLLNENVYTAAYPLHDGDLRKKGSTRNLLYTEWSAITKWYRYQPLDYIKEYFGVKISLYFAWLGFYTYILLPAALVGVGCFVYSCLTLYDNKPSEDICNPNLTVQMCPLCDDWCGYWNLQETCTHARMAYLFDNSGTVFFTIFMSIWGALFLEMWKRYSAEITHRWDLTGFDVQEEHPRPQYLARLSHVKRQQVNVVTNTMEPCVPFWRMKLPVTLLSFSVVILLVAMALAAVVAVVLYRMSNLVVKIVYGDKADKSSAILLTTVTAACINLGCIVVFNLIYSYVAEYLTELEFLRTQSEFDDSLTLKIYLLQFVNYYASIFYIAFFKGKIIGSPRRYNKVFGYRQEECGPEGCLVELCIQLGIIMIGKQALNTVLEMVFPLFFKWLNTLKVKTGISKDCNSCKAFQPQWVKDFKLVEWGPRSLFPEYLEMVLQYGFVTLFVSAFPLAPLFALLNNILEMRLDAKKLLTYYRRPVSQRVRDIGVWYRILDSIGKLSVITNAFIIAFTSDFIPRLVYAISYSDDFSLNGFLNHSLSYFNTSDFQVGSAPMNYSAVEICRYPDYREPPWSENKYERTSTYWYILVARLTFVVIFENVVVLVIIIVKWCVPDVPGELSDRIRRETYITNEIIIKQETIRAQSGQLFKTTSLSSETLSEINDCPATPEQWDRLISKSLSGSDFDLMVHSHSFPATNKKKEELKIPTSV